MITKKGLGGQQLKRKTVLLILGLAGFVVMADSYVVSPILPAIAKSIGVPPTTAGLLITAYLIPFGMFQLVFGPLADRYGKRQVLTLSIIFFTFAAALTSAGRDLSELSLYRALTGMFAASIMPVSLALIGDLVPLPERQAAIGTFIGISFLGQGLSMIIGGSIAFFLNWRGVFLAYSGLAAIVAVLFLTIGRTVPSGQNPNGVLLRTYGRLLGSGHSLSLYLVVLFEGLLIIGSFSYLGSFIQHAYDFNALSIGFIMTIFGGMAIVGGRVSGTLATKVGRRKVLLLGLACATVADALFYLRGDQLGVLMVGIGLLGLGYTLAHSTLLIIATEFAAAARGAAISLVAFFFMGGGGVGTAIGGRLIKSEGYPSFFFVYSLALLFLVGAVWLVINAETRSVMEH